MTRAPIYATAILAAPQPTERVMKKEIKVMQKPEAEVPTEVLADAIVNISQGVRKLRSGRMNDRALLLLIQHATPRPVSIRDIKAVFDGIDSLEGLYLKKRP